jgi:hypothetical protein
VSAKVTLVCQAAVVQQLRRERARTQTEVERLDSALAALGSLDGVSRVLHRRDTAPEFEHRDVRNQGADGPDSRGVTGHHFPGAPTFNFLDEPIVLFGFLLACHFPGSDRQDVDSS